MVRTGRLESSGADRTELVSDCRQGPLHARCELILGLVARESGLIDEGLQRLQTSARLAKECGDVRCEATSLLMALRMISESQPIRGR